MEIIRPLALFLCLCVIIVSSVSVAMNHTGNEVNVIWVIDDLYLRESSDSRKMEDDLASLLCQLDSAGVKYHMAVTTTDFFDNNGKLVSDTAGISMIDSADPAHYQKFVEILTSVNPSGSSFWRQGLETSTLAVKQNAGFVESGVPLSVIYLSDEDDYSCAANCYGVEPWDNKMWVRKAPALYVDEFKDIEKQQNIPITLYPIVGLPNTNCTIDHVGQNYQLAQNLMGSGLTGSVCLNDLGKSVFNIGRDIIRNLSKK